MKNNSQIVLNVAVALTTAAVLFAGWPSCFSAGKGKGSIKGSMITEPIGGQPSAGSKPSVRNLEEQVVYHRAFEALVWSQPAAGLYGFRRAFNGPGIIVRPDVK